MTSHQADVQWANVASAITSALQTIGHDITLISSAQKLGQSEFVAVNELSQDLREKIAPKTVRGILTNFEDMIEEDTNFSRKCYAYVAVTNLHGINIGDIIIDGDPKTGTWSVNMVKPQRVGAVSLVFELELRQ